MTRLRHKTLGVVVDVSEETAATMLGAWESAGAEVEPKPAAEPKPKRQPKS